MAADFTFSEFKEVVYLEDAFDVFKNARLSVYRSTEVLEYIALNELLNTNIDIVEQKEKLNGFLDDFKKLETGLGIGNSTELINDKTGQQNEVTLDTIFKAIKDYMTLKVLIDQELSDVLYRIRNYLFTTSLVVIKRVNAKRPGAALAYEAAIRNDSSVGLNKVSLDHDKIVTYQITSKQKDMQKFIASQKKEDVWFKIRSFDYQIESLYDEIQFLYKNLMNLNILELEVDSLIQAESSQSIQETISKRLFWFGLLTLIFTILSTTISLFVWLELDIYSVIRMFN